MKTNFSCLPWLVSIDRFHCKNDDIIENQSDNLGIYIAPFPEDFLKNTKCSTMSQKYREFVPKCERQWIPRIRDLEMRKERAVVNRSEYDNKHVTFL